MLIMFVFLTLAPHMLFAQFIRLQLELDDEVTVRDSRPLNFGGIPPNYGWVRVGMADELAGRMSISTTENINLLVSVIAPEQLVRDERNTMPFELEAAYYNSIPQRRENPVLFDGNTAYFPVNDGGKLVEQMDRRREKLEASLFFFGAAFAGNIEPGVYFGEIIVRVEYE